MGSRPTFATKGKLTTHFVFVCWRGGETNAFYRSQESQLKSKQHHYMFVYTFICEYVCVFAYVAHMHVCSSNIVGGQQKIYKE